MIKERDKLLGDGKRLICISKIMNEGLLTLKENYTSSDKYAILLKDMLSRNNEAKAAIITSETFKWTSTAQVYLKKNRLSAAAMTCGCCQ